VALPADGDRNLSFVRLANDLNHIVR
jgi:hypothetical protein